jgi:hypothetical protein
MREAALLVLPRCGSAFCGRGRACRVPAQVSIEIRPQKRL